MGLLMIRTVIVEESELGKPSDVSLCDEGEEECLGRYYIYTIIAYTTIGDEIDYDNCLVKEMEEKKAPGISSDCIWSQDCDVSDCESYSDEYDLQDEEDLEECLENLRGFAADVHESILDEIDEYLIEKAKALFPEEMTFHGRVYRIGISYETYYDLPAGEIYLMVYSDSRDDLEYLREHFREFLEELGWPDVIEEQCYLTLDADEIPDF